MNEVCLKVENLGKRYLISHGQLKSDYLSERILRGMSAPFRRIVQVIKGNPVHASEADSILWAVKDVTFEVRRGQVVGVIGRNGAGKSTLLKILAGITDPNEGYAEITGRVASLLEVGSGFHPELTGRENVYLNGAVLGMRKEEIDRKMEEIVSFAEVGDFLDTPIKHYSSGMYVRLAFSIAAHLEPEILLVDEVLAVGDAAFQRKCLGKMDDVCKEGRTVLFVSHNMGLIESICERGILLESGRVAKQGDIREVVSTYLKTIEDQQHVPLLARTDRRGKAMSQVAKFEILDENNNLLTALRSGGPARFRVHVTRKLPGMNCTIEIIDHLGHPVTVFRSKSRASTDSFERQDPLCFTCHLDDLFLLPGRYRADISITGDNRLQDSIKGAGFFDVIGGSIGGRPTVIDKRFRVGLPHRWTIPAEN
ncbi:MAG TPA: ABC transporter ATP-binding protein [Acidobacteriota bacterium]|nr:ABC transporter ATP-binding protein [Acidobacteriota bacterium]